MEKDFNNEQQEYELQQIATKKVAKLKAFYMHIFFYVAGIMVYVAKEYLGFRLNFFL